MTIFFGGIFISFKEGFRYAVPKVSFFDTLSFQGNFGYMRRKTLGRQLYLSRLMYVCSLAVTMHVFQCQGNRVRCGPARSTRPRSWWTGWRPCRPIPTASSAHTRSTSSQRNRWVHLVALCLSLPLLFLFFPPLIKKNIFFLWANFWPGGIGTVYPASLISG